MAFLDKLDIPAEDREKLSKLCASSTLAILLMRKANPEVFDDYIGRDRVPGIEAALFASLNDVERKVLAEPPPTVWPPLGARIGTPPRR